MKQNNTGNEIKYSIALLSLLFTLPGSDAQAGTMGPVAVADSGKAYIGVFGGGGSSNRVNISQYGTAFFTEANGGPLAVNAVGQTNNRDVGIVGGQVGYQWAEHFLTSLSTQWSLSPAVELEGYYLGQSSFTGQDLNNNTARLVEHDFLVNYPLSSGAFLTNAVLNFNPTQYNRLHPYIAGGIGAAILAITNANSTQVAPAEVDVNHYNANSSDKDATFATQVKVGLNFDLMEHVNIFAEYRGLYLAASHFTFGSTVYPTHAETSNWMVNFNGQFYNMGAAGVRLSI